MYHPRPRTPPTYPLPHFALSTSYRKSLRSYRRNELIYFRIAWRTSVTITKIEAQNNEEELKTNSSTSDTHPLGSH